MDLTTVAQEVLALLSSEGVALTDDVNELGSNFELLDQSLQFEPFQRYARDEGGVPLWNPHVMAGRPFHANSQSAIFSPFSAPAYMTDVSRAFVAGLGGVLAILLLHAREVVPEPCVVVMQVLVGRLLSPIFRAIGQPPVVGNERSRPSKANSMPRSSSKL